jgi:hypothetical protein
MGPRLVVQMASEVSAYIRNVYGNGSTKKYHLNDIKVYYPWSEEQIPIFRQRAALDIDIAQLDVDPQAMQIAGSPGSRFVDLTTSYMV